MHLENAKCMYLFAQYSVLFIAYMYNLTVCMSICTLKLRHAGQYVIQKVVPQASGESSKVKVKVRVNIHGIFSVSSASLVEVQKSEEEEESMDTEQSTEKENEVFLQDITHRRSHALIVTCVFVLLVPSYHRVYHSQNKMQVDQEEQKTSGNGEQEDGEKKAGTEEMEVNGI